MKIELKWSKTVKGSKSLSTTDRLLLVLITLRQHFDFQHISHLFNVSSQDSSAILTQSINYMFFRLGSLDIWPHRDPLIENIPESYKKDFLNTLVIIDCTKLKVQKNNNTKFSP